MNRVLSALAFSLSVAAVTACGQPFDVKTAPGFIALENQPQHAYRATTPDGVVLGIRVVDDEDRGDLGFWTQSLVLQLRDASGYALLRKSETTSADGTKGALLEFGHDVDGKPYVYWVAVYLAQDRLFLVETGGEKTTFEKARPNVEQMMRSVKVKCGSFVAPVLASRTCNHW